MGIAYSIFNAGPCRTMTKMSKLNLDTAGLNDVRCLELRKLMHELSNVTTGILISSGLLAQLLIDDKRIRYCEQINEAGERSAVLVRQARALLHPEEHP